MHHLRDEVWSFLCPPFNKVEGGIVVSCTFFSDDSL